MSLVNTISKAISASVYWGDSNRTIVIVDSSHIDKGIAFRPTDKKAFFDRLISAGATPE
jgi:hypothetical protein